jgi:hypothetical protein
MPTTNMTETRLSCKRRFFFPLSPAHDCRSSRQTNSANEADRTAFEAAVIETSSSCPAPRPSPAIVVAKLVVEGSDLGEGRIRVKM